MHIEYLVAWLLPLWIGCGLWSLANGRRPFCGSTAASIGSGWIVGLYVAAAFAGWRASADTTHALACAAPWLTGLGVLVWIPAVWRLRMRTGSAAHVANHGQASPVSRAARALWWLLLTLIVVRLALLADEASLRPIFPWDAWSAWAVKPKSWMLLGHADRYVPMLQWLTDPDSHARTLASWNYPQWLAWIEIWFASGAGGWNEPLVDLAWSGALAAFAVAAYGYWRGLGLRPIVAMGLVYALVSLPLIDAHVALAGYADLWLAITLGLATLAWSRWLIFRERGQWLLSAALVLCLPLIKLEGAIWVLLFSAVMVLDLLPPRWRWRMAGAVVALCIVGLVCGGFSLPMLGLGWVRVAWGSVTIPGVATFELSWHAAVGRAMLASLFTLPNWHLLWYAFPVVVALRWRRLLGDHAAHMLGLLVLLQLLFLFVLFFFTSAAAWAEDFTSANRLILQMVPTVFVVVAVLLRNRGNACPAMPT
jgi:hypothetical protein